MQQITSFTVVYIQSIIFLQLIYNVLSAIFLKEYDKNYRFQVMSVSLPLFFGKDREQNM